MGLDAVHGLETGAGPIFVGLTLERSLRGETIIFPGGMAGLTAVQPGGKSAERVHIDKMLEITADDGALAIETRSGERLVADRIHTAMGMGCAYIYLTNGTRRYVDLIEEVKRIAAEVDG